MDNDKILTREELHWSKQYVVEAVAKGLMSQTLADRILQPIFTALSLYAEKEAMGKRVKGLIEKYKKHSKALAKEMEILVGDKGNVLELQKNTIDNIIVDLQGLAKEGG